MTPRQTRRERREAERKSKKAAIKSAKNAAERHQSAKDVAKDSGGVLENTAVLHEFRRRERVAHSNHAPAAAAARVPENTTGFVSQNRRSSHLETNETETGASIPGKLDVLNDLDGFVPQNARPTSAGKTTKRAEANRVNARLSTGPRTPEGKLASSRNSTQHGLASGQTIIPGESPVDFKALLDDLVSDHQPATPTEDLLVKEMAQSYWLAQRAIRLQNECFTAEGIDEKRLALFLRYQTTHDRAFYKALNTLLRLKKEAARAARGFVLQPKAQPRELAEQTAQGAPELNGFVPQNAPPEPENIMVQARREAA